MLKIQISLAFTPTTPKECSNLFKYFFARKRMDFYYNIIFINNLFGIKIHVIVKIRTNDATPTIL